MTRDRREQPSHDETPAERRARLDEIFGEVMPETTSDERDPGDSRGEDDPADAWLRAQVPPHHG